jgi:hypothetical protein
MWGGVENEPAVHFGYLFNLVLEEAFGRITHWWHCQAAFSRFD